MEQTRFFKIVFNDDSVDEHLFHTKEDVEYAITIFETYGKKVKGLAIIIVSTPVLNDN